MNEVLQSFVIALGNHPGKQHYSNRLSTGCWRFDYITEIY